MASFTIIFGIFVACTVSQINCDTSCSEEFRLARTCVEDVRGNKMESQPKIEAQMQEVVHRCMVNNPNITTCRKEKETVNSCHDQLAANEEKLEETIETYYTSLDSCFTQHGKAKNALHDNLVGESPFIYFLLEQLLRFGGIDGPPDPAPTTAFTGNRGRSPNQQSIEGNGYMGNQGRSPNHQSRRIEGNGYIRQKRQLGSWSPQGFELSQIEAEQYEQPHQPGQVYGPELMCVPTQLETHCIYATLEGLGQQPDFQDLLRKQAQPIDKSPCFENITSSCRPNPVNLDLDHCLCEAKEALETTISMEFVVCMREAGFSAPEPPTGFCKRRPPMPDLQNLNQEPLDDQKPLKASQGVLFSEDDSVKEVQAE